MRAALLTIEMTQEFRVRRLRPEDAVQLEALYARTRNPYREEDAGAVEAMHRLALQARETGCRWSALPPEARNVSDAEHRAFWVAVPLANGMPEIIGTVGLRIVGDSRSADADTVESSGLPSAEKWTQTADVGEVRRLRVLPEWRRRGVATALMSELIS